ncbi:MAG: PP2C family protein-serine/threonine phosphatase [Legionellaceae bacterium]|nr:PP2C family protein-serine/threonine phosphatase [Legionellaceae bacterium]
MGRYYKLLATDTPKTKQKQACNFGVCSHIGGLAHHVAQEDAVVYQEYDEDILCTLTPEEIGQRLWTGYHVLNQNFSNDHPDDDSGTTASITIIKGEHLITATLADTIAYAVVWGADDTLLGLKRLTKRTHTPDLPEEALRINQVLTERSKMPLKVIGDRIVYKKRKVQTTLNVSRAIGDKDFRPVIITDADINITSISKILKELHISSMVEKVQVITVSDGFTNTIDRARKLPNKNQKYETRMHELCLRRGLKDLRCFDEKSIAIHLTQTAISAGSKDNVTVAVQTIMAEGESPTFMGMHAVFDGHGGKIAANYSMECISDVLHHLFKMNPKEYDDYLYSVSKQSEQYQLFCLDHSTLVVGSISHSAIGTADKLLNDANVNKKSNPLNHQIKTSSSLILSYLSKELVVLLTVAFLIATVFALMIGICGVVGFPSSETHVVTLGVVAVSAFGLGYWMFKSAYPFVLSCFEPQSNITGLWTKTRSNTGPSN